MALPCPRRTPSSIASWMPCDPLGFLLRASASREGRGERRLAKEGAGKVGSPAGIHA
jgi:hypothetical protein